MRNLLVKTEFFNNLFFLFHCEFIDLYKLFEKADIKTQIIVVKKLKELNRIIKDLSWKSVNLRIENSSKTSK